MRISDWSSDVCSSDLQPQCVDRVERLRAAGHLHHREGPPLGRALAAELQRQMVDLRLHDAGDLAVPFGTAPHHRFRPQGMLAQLMDCRMIVTLDLIGQRQIARNEYERSEEQRLKSS